MSDEEMIKEIKETTSKLNKLICNLPDRYRIDVDTIEKRNFVDRFPRPILVIDILEAK